MKTVQKKNTEEVGVAKANQFHLRCGDCLHYKGSSHPAFGKPCNVLGVKSYAAAPPCYTPNVVSFRKVGSEVFATMGVLLSTFTPQQHRILMGLLKNAGSLQKYGLTFLQKVYFKVGGDFLDNYFSGRVLGVGAGGTISVVGESFFVAIKNPVIAFLFRDNLLSVAEFKKKKSYLEKHGMLYAPKQRKRNVIEDGYEPPTMETSPELLEKMGNLSPLRKNRKKIKITASGAMEVDLGQEDDTFEPEEDKIPEEKSEEPKKRGRKKRAAVPDTSDDMDYSEELEED